MCSLLLTWQGCDVRSASQEQVRQKLEAGLRPYFPRVQVTLDRDQQKLTAYTCAANLGEAAVKMVPMILDRDENFQKLKQFHAPLRLHSFEMYFDHYILTLDFDRDQYQTIAIEQVSGGTARNAQACGQSIV